MWVIKNNIKIIIIIIFIIITYTESYIITRTIFIALALWQSYC